MDAGFKTQFVDHAAEIGVDTAEFRETLRSQASAWSSIDPLRR
jgi:hypothetical protein